MEKLRRKMYGAIEDAPPLKPKFAIVDRARVSKYRGRFKKAREQGWSNDIYTICGIRNGASPVTYTLLDAAGSIVPGSYYEPKLARTAFTSKSQTEPLAPRMREEDVGPDQVKRFIGWRKPNCWHRECARRTWGPIK